MKFFQVTAIINSQSRRIETNVKEDNARLTQNILNQNQKNDKTTLTIPENPIDNLNLSSNYIKMNQKNNERDIIEITSKENLKKIKLLQIAISEKYGKGIKIYIPDTKKSEKKSESAIYGRDDRLNRQLIDKENLLSNNLLNQNFNQKGEITNIKTKDKYIFYMDNSGEFSKDLFEIFHEKYILLKYDIADMEFFDTNMNFYSSLRIWDASENVEKPDLFVIGFKNYGAIFCGDILSNFHSSLKQAQEYTHVEKIHIDIKL